MGQCDARAGAGNSVGKYANNPNGTDLKFIFPESQVTVHSTGDTSLSPAAVMELSAKSAVPFFGPGQSINYRTVLNNTGNLSGNVFITDTLPLSMTLITETLSASSGGAPMFDGSQIAWNGVVTENATVSIWYALTPTIDLGLMQPQTNTVVITGGVVPVTRTATTVLALNAYLPIVMCNFAP